VGQLTEQERAHAASILDPEPTLKPIPPERRARILCCIPLRKPAIVVQQLLRTLAWQKIRRAELNVLVAPNYSTDAEAAEPLALLASPPTNMTVWPNEAAPIGDYADGAETRQWTKPAFGRLAQLKNRMLQYALDEGYDFVWLLDADVMCDPFTLQSMLDSADIERWYANDQLAYPIVSAVYWTRWQNPQPGSTDQVHAGPQVWLVHPYQLHGHGWTEPDFRAALVARKRVRVWGLGACTLIPRHALAKGVSFAPFDGLPPGPMSEGEDRHFCAHATARHVPLIADAWPDIYHAYHPHEYEQLAERVTALERPPYGHAVQGDLVSGKLEILEPVADPNGRFQRLRAHWLRGKLGTLPVLPQVEEALAALKPGEAKLVKLHFPVHWPRPELRLKSLIARVTLFDAKPWRIPPVVDEELMVGNASRRIIDSTTHTWEQLRDIAEAPHAD